MIEFSNFLQKIEQIIAETTTENLLEIALSLISCKRSQEDAFILLKKK